MKHYVLTYGLYKNHYAGAHALKEWERKREW